MFSLSSCIKHALGLPCVPFLLATNTVSCVEINQLDLNI